MKLWLAQVVLQLFLALGLSPFVSGFIRKLKAVLQNRRGPSLWQPYHDLFKWVRKGTVVSQQASWLFRATPYVSFLTALMVSLMVPMVTAVVPLSYFGGVLAVVYLLALARFFVALAALDTASAFGGMGSSREMVRFLNVAVLVVLMAVAASPTAAAQPTKKSAGSKPARGSSRAGARPITKSPGSSTRPGPMGSRPCRRSWDGRRPPAP